MTLSLAQHKMKLSSVAVEANLREDLPQVPCDASQIQQVALNLLLNAAEATQSRSERRVAVATSARDGMVLLTVSDNGEGIPKENLAKIFDPFFTTKPEGKGVGLGLAVSYGIVEAHGGDIEVQSTVGEGTTFTRLAAAGAAGAAERDPPGASGPEGMKYLYVGAMAEVDGEALAAVRERVAAEFGVPVRPVELPSADFAYDAGRGQYGSIPVLEMLARRCPEDALKLVARHRAGPVHPGADLRFRAGAIGRPGGGGVAGAAAAGVLRAGAQPRDLSRARLERGAARSRPHVRAGALRGPGLRHGAFDQRPADRFETSRFLRPLRGAIGGVSSREQS